VFKFPIDFARFLEYPGLKTARIETRTAGPMVRRPGLERTEANTMGRYVALGRLAPNALAVLVD